MWGSSEMWGVGGGLPRAHVLHCHPLVTVIDAAILLVQPVRDLGMEVQGVKLRTPRTPHMT